MIIGEYLTFLIGGDWLFSPNMNSLSCQPFKGVSWALVLGLPLKDTIKGLLLVLGPFLIPRLGLYLGPARPLFQTLSVAPPAFD